MPRFSLYPQRVRFFERLRDDVSKSAHAWQGEVFRFIDPRFSRRSEIFDGQGALHAAGRWHLVRMGRVAYAAVEPETAMAETLAAARYHGFPLSSATPLVLVSGRAVLSRVLDLRDSGTHQALRVTRRKLMKADWRAENASRREAVTQALGWALLQAGVEAALVPSAAQAGGTNVIVFPANLAKGSALQLIRAVKWPS